MLGTIFSTPATFHTNRTLLQLKRECYPAQHVQSWSLSLLRIWALTRPKTLSIDSVYQTMRIQRTRGRSRSHQTKATLELIAYSCCRVVLLALLYVSDRSMFRLRFLYLASEVGRSWTARTANLIIASFTTTFSTFLAIRKTNGSPQLSVSRSLLSHVT